MKRTIALFGLVFCSIQVFAAKPVRIGISITPSTATIYGGSTVLFAANVTGTTNAAVTWSTTAGTVTSTGLYTAPSVSAKATAYITATSVADSSKKATAAVSVNPSPPALAQIVVSPSSASIYVGSTQQFSAVAYDQYGHTMTGISVTFFSSNYAVAGINSVSGLATGATVGTAYISAYSGNVTSNSAVLNVNAVPPPSPPHSYAALPNFWADWNKR